ncbi:MAG: c-type cytochrome [Gaiellaceae bacterium]
MRLRVLVLAVLAVLLAGCGSGTLKSAAPVTVIGTLPKAPTIPKGDAAAGKSLFVSNGCGGCHAYKPAASTGKVGPGLDNLPADAQKANQGSLEEYVATSITSPGAYVVPGYPNGVMPSFNQLTPKQVGDLVAFLTQTH